MPLKTYPKFNFVHIEVQLQYYAKHHFHNKKPMSELKKKFGKKVQSLRLETGITQEQLASAMGLTIESISNIERGIYGPKFDNLEKIANVLGVAVRDLFDF